MKITKSKLAQIIKEEVEAYKASQLNEGMDLDKINEVEGYLKEIADLLHSTYEDLYKAHAPAVFTPQTKADTGEDVTEETAHRDAKDFILTTLGEHIDGFEKKDIKISLDGNILSIQACKETPEDDHHMICNQRPNIIDKKIRLPVDVNDEEDSVSSAKYSQGVLTITIPVHKHGKDIKVE